MTRTRFEGGPLDGQDRCVADHVDTFVMQVMDVRPDFVWSWEDGGFVYAGPPGDIPDVPPAAVRTVTYRRDGGAFRLE